MADYEFSRRLHKRSKEEEEAIAEAAEQQMRRWLLREGIKERLEHEEVEEFSRTIHPYISISRESGAGGDEIATLVGEKLGWNVLSKELLTFMSERYCLPRDMLEFLDETTANWMHEYFGKWLDRQAIRQEEYVHHLGVIVLIAVQKESAVLVGRGAHYFLPPNRGLTVRVVASEEYRVKHIMEARGIEREEALKFMREAEEGREEFVRRYYHRDVSDISAYDLVVNPERIGQQNAADLIVQAYENWSAANK